jgi:hypothetical protein
MGRRTGVFALAALIALAAVSTGATPARNDLDPPAAAPSAPTAVDSSTIEATPLEALPVVQFVARERAGDPRQFVRLTVSFVRDSAHPPEVIAVVFIPDTVSKTRMETLVQAVGYVLVGESRLPGGVRTEPPNRQGDPARPAVQRAVQRATNTAQVVVVAPRALRDVRAASTPTRARIAYAHSL